MLASSLPPGNTMATASFTWWNWCANWRNQRICDKESSKNTTSLSLGFSFLIIEELEFSGFFKKVGCFCRVEANLALPYKDWVKGFSVYHSFSTQFTQQWNVLESLNPSAQPPSHSKAELQLTRSNSTSFLWEFSFSQKLYPLGLSRV